MDRVIAIVGPTSSGKTALGIRLAQRFHGEIVSADSRQVYAGFDLCSGKATRREQKGIPHFLLDVASPRKTYSVARFVKDAQGAISAILQRGHIPFVVGGTGFYLDALLTHQRIPEVKPNPLLRRQLERKTAAELFALLKAKDPERARTIDARNPRRLVRALEIIAALGAVPKPAQSFAYQALCIGLNPKPGVLRKRIRQRLMARVRKGMVREIKNLHDHGGLSWKRLECFGLELKYGAQYLQGKISKLQMLEDLETAIGRYAKRQLTWFKRNKSIHWVKTAREAEILVRNFLKQ